MKRLLSLFLSLALLLSCLVLPAGAAGQHPFRDVPAGHWAGDAVGYVYENNLMNGTGPTAFQPEGTLTRAMFVTILGRMDGVEASQYSGSRFSDVAPGQWYSPYVAWSFQNHIVNGTGGGLFSPDLAVTREEMATMIARYVDAQGLTLPQADRPASPFTDQAAISSWAKEGVELMRQTGLLSGYGDGRFGPHQTATRAEAATIFMRLDKALTPAPPQETLYEQFVSGEKALLQIEQTFLDSEGYVPREDIPALLDAAAGYAQKAKAAGELLSYQQGESSVYLEFPGNLGYLFVPYTKDTLQANTAAFTPTGSIVNKLGFSVREAEAWIDATHSGYQYDAAEDSAEKVAALTPGASAAVFSGSKVTIDRVKDMGRYQVILWEGHGAYSEKTHSCLVTDEVVTPLNLERYRDDLKAGNLVMTSGNPVDLGAHFYCITPRFIDTYLDDLDHALVFLGACSSGKDDALANAFLQKGADVVLGYTEETYIPYEMLTRSFFFQFLCQENTTVKAALAATKGLVSDDVKNDIPGELVSFPGESGYLLNPVEAPKTYITGTVCMQIFDTVPQPGVKVTLYCRFGAGGEDIAASCVTGADGTFRLEVPAGATALVRLEVSGERLIGPPYHFPSSQVVSQDVGQLTVSLAPLRPLLPSAADRYQEFLAGKEYQSAIENWWCVPQEYALLDINQDGTEELILQGSDGVGFYNFALFTYDRARDQVLPLSYVSDDEFNGLFSGYGELGYAEAHQALVITPLKPTQLAGSMTGFFQVKDQSLALAFSLSGSAGQGYVKTTPGAGSVPLTEQEKDTYLLSASALPFQPLPG